MTWMIPRGWRALVLPLPSLAVLAAPLSATARASREPNQERKRDIGELPVTGGRAGAFPEINLNTGNVGVQGTAAGMPVRKVTPDEDPMRELSGQVVKLNGLVLYVQTGLGAVVPLD